MEIYEMTALQVAEKIKNKEITSMDAVESIAKAIEQNDGTYNCYEIGRASCRERV